jgi:DNA polymerase I-like protein with 3'-5' exonuclease and polymerase domains
MSRLHPNIALLHELRVSLSQIRLGEIPVGKDGRNRVLLSPYRSKTGRNQPSNAAFIFGTATWLRSLIVPPPGRFVAYVDWTSQEIGIAAKLAEDANLLSAYDDDPYLWFAKRVGAVPADATKKSHKALRDLYKATMLGVGYGMGETSLAMRIGQPVAKARSLLLQHRETFPALWSWMNGAVNHALLTGRIVARFGWAYHVGDDPNPRSLQNWPVQSNAAEMMRLAACMLTEAGIEVCCPVHDAFLIEGPADMANEIVVRTQNIMAEASALTLDGFRLRSDAKIVMPGERYHDERGQGFFERIVRILEES